MTKHSGVRALSVAAIAMLLSGCLALPSHADDAAKDTPFKVHERAYRKTLAKRAQSGNAEAMTYLAMLKEQGDEIEPIDLAGAFDLYEKAALQGNPIAVKKMCLAYLLGNGQPKDVVKASGFCNKVDEQDAVTFFWGGYDYQNGVTGPKDIDSAKAAYQEAFVRGSGEAADALGRIAYDDGHLDAARDWFRRGASLGSVDAMDHLAGMVEEGQAGDKDPVEAVWLYGLAAQWGNRHAQDWLASHPHPEVPESVLARDKTEVTLTHTYLDAGQVKTEPLTASRLSVLMHKRLGGIVHPGGATDYYYATFECYVRAARDVDLCVAAREFPLGFSMASILHAIWDGPIAAPEHDVRGNAMAQTRFRFGVMIEFTD